MERCFILTASRPNLRIMHQGRMHQRQIQYKTWEIIFLKDVSRLFDDEGRAPSAACGVWSNRVEEYTFFHLLADFKKLMEIPHAFGELLGSAASLFKALSLADRSIPERYRLTCTSYCDVSYGPGFPNNAFHVVLAISHRIYEACLSTIRSHCGCKLCRSSTCHPQPEEDSEMTPAPREVQEDNSSPEKSVFRSDSQEAESVGGCDPNRFCEVFMAETIIYLFRTLPNVVLEDKSLCRVRKGLELAYCRPESRFLTTIYYCLST